MRAFLRYLVEKELAGQGDQIKETALAIDVFERGPEYDPKADTIVRVEARRLRRCLAQYYAGEGVSDAVRIDIPKGQYRPVFVPRIDTSLPAGDRVIVMPGGKPFQPRRAWTRPLPLGVGIFLVVAAVLVATRKLTPDANHLPLRISPITALPGSKGRGAISPDGSRIVFAWDAAGHGDTQIYLKSTHGEDPPRKIAGVDGANDDFPAWSPDGTMIAFLRNTGPNGEAYVIGADAGPERKLADTSGLDIAWTADGYVAVLPKDPVDRGLILISPRDDSRNYLALPKEGEIRRWRFSADGKKLAAIICERGCDIFVAALSGTKPGSFRPLTHDQTLIGALDWIPDSNAVIYSSAKSGIRKLWKTTVPPDGTEQAPTSELLVPGIEDAYYPSVAVQDSRHIQVAFMHERMDENVWRIPITAGAEPVTSFIATTRADRMARYSQDGKRLAFVSDRAGSREIYVCDPDGKNPVQWTRFSVPDAGDPWWSPDGKHLVMSALIGSNYQLFISDGPTTPPRPLTDGTSSDFKPIWSRDGFIYFSSRRTGRPEIWRIAPDGTNLQRVTFNGGFEVRETADGRYRIVQNDDGLWKQTLPNGKLELLSKDVQNGYWDIFGDDVYFLDWNERTLRWPMRDTSHGTAQVSRLSILTGTVAQVRSIETTVFNETANFSISADGKYVLLGQIDHADSDFLLIEGIAK